MDVSERPVLAAISATDGSRSALASAMLTFSESGAGGFDAERIDHLLGDAPAWSFPAVLCLLALSAIVLLLALGLLAGRVAVGSASLAPPVLSRQPCVVVLALLPLGLALTAWRIRRRPARGPMDDAAAQPVGGAGPARS